MTEQSLSGKMTRLRRAPVLKITVYYIVLSAAALLLLRLFPNIESLFPLLGAPVLGLADLQPGTVVPPGAAETAPTLLGRPGMALLTILGMAGALALVLPVAWVYMITKQRQGYDQSVVQTVIILPIAVTGIVLIVRDSVALAFSLAGIVAAVRFRNTLKDTKDAVYIFLAIGVGLASGVQALNVAFAMSIMFNLVVLALWKYNVGNIYADQLSRTGPLGMADSLAGGLGAGETVTVGDADVATSLKPEQLSGLTGRAERVARYVKEAADSGKKPFNGLLLVHVTDEASARPSVESALEENSKRWKFLGVVSAGDGRSTLEYLIRLRKSILPEVLLDAVESGGAPHVVGAEFKGLKTAAKDR